MSQLLDQTQNQNQARISIAIIGAGIAGPVLALQILSHPTLRALYKPVIYDKLPPPPPPPSPSPFSSSTSLHEQEAHERGRASYAAGAAVALTSNALFPLYSLGLREGLHKVSSETTRINVWRARDYAHGLRTGRHKWYNIIRNPNWKPEFDTNLRVVERRDLQALLLEKIAELGGEVLWGKKLTGVTKSEGSGTMLKFADESVVYADLLVGGDGNWSSVRKFIIEQKSAENIEERWAPEFPFCSGVYGICKKFGSETSEGNAPGDTHWVLLDLGVASTWALPDGKIFWTISLPEASPPARANTTDTVQPSPETQQTLYGADLTCGGYSFDSTIDLLKKHERVWHPVAGSFGDIFRNSDRIVRAPLWHKAWEADEIGCASAVVVGDASRAMLPSSGQGACFAIEDATVLANALLNHPPLTEEGCADFEAAVSEYARLRVPRSKRMATQAYWTGVVGLGVRWWSRWLRDFGSSWLPLGNDPKANSGAATKDPMAWLHDVRYTVKLAPTVEQSGDM